MARPKKLDDKQLIKILNFISDRQDRNRILATLNKSGNVSNSTLGRWLEYLENERELILRIPKTRPQLFELTYKGGQELTKLRNFITLDNPDIMKSQKTLYSLENYFVKFEVIKAGEIFTPTEVQMNNWIQKIDNWRDCNIRYNQTNDGKPISLTIEPLALIGDDKRALLLKARAICDSGAHLLKNQFGFILSPIKVNPGVIELANHITKALHEEYGYVKGHLDASKLGGELNFTGASEPEELADRVESWENIPKVQNTIMRELQYLKEQNEILMSTVANLIHSEGQTQETLNKLLARLKQEPEPSPPSDPIPEDSKAQDNGSGGMYA